MSALAAGLGLLTGGAILGGLAHPLTRKLMLGDIKQDWLCNQLEFDRIDEDQITIHNKDGSLFRVVRLRGVLYESKDAEAQQNYAISRALLLKQLSEFKVKLRFYGVKRLRPINIEAEWPTPALKEIGDREKALFQESYKIEWFIAISSLNRQKLNEACQRLESLLSEYKPVLLKRQEDQHCPLNEFLSYLITGECYQNLPANFRNISANVPSCDLNFQADGILKTKSPLDHYSCVIAVKAWPEEVSGALASAIMALPFEIELFQAIFPMSDEIASGIIKLKQRQFNMAGPFASETLTEEFATAGEVVAGGTSSLCETQYQITVRAASMPALQASIKQVCDICGKLRVNYSIETKGAVVCWFNRMPGKNGDRLLRPLKLFSEPLGCLWPFAASPAGMQASPWDDRPVRLFPTPSGQTYAMQFHNSIEPQSLGHFLVFAPSGSGKSTLILHLLAGLAKMNKIRSYIFDSKEGTRFMVESFGGNYQNFEKLALNPLDVSSDTPASRQSMKQVLYNMVGGLEITPRIDEELDRAIAQAMMIAPPDRTFNAIYESAFAHDQATKAALAKWIVTAKGRKGAYSHILNAPRDSLAGFLDDNFMVGINMNEALDDPTLGAPIVTHISEMISKTAAKNSKGFAIFVDEAAKLLQNEGFKHTVQEMFREYRKLNGVVGLAFQDPAALEKSGIAESVLESTATLFFFPNPRGKRDQYKAFGLQDEELDFILTNIGKEQGGRPVLVVKDDSATGIRESAIINIDLAPFGDALRFYKSGTDAVQLLERLQSQYGDEKWINYI